MSLVRLKWIPLTNGRFKLNFNGSRINNISTSRWVIRDSYEIIKMTRSRHLGDALITTAKCGTLRDDILATIYNGFSNLMIEGDSKVVIYCYNK